MVLVNFSHYRDFELAEHKDKVRQNNEENGQSPYGQNVGIPPPQLKVKLEVSHKSAVLKVLR
jgi:hypothetical protein